MEPLFDQKFKERFSEFLQNNPKIQRQLDDIEKLYMSGKDDQKSLLKIRADLLALNDYVANKILSELMSKFPILNVSLTYSPSFYNSETAVITWKNSPSQEKRQENNLNNDSYASQSNDFQYK